MARIYAAEAQTVNFEEDVKYELHINDVTFEEGGKFGDQFKFDFKIPALGLDSHWVWASTKLGKHQGRVSKLRGIINGALGHAEGDEIEWVDGETFEVKYKNSDKIRKFGSGMVLRGKGEYVEDDNGVSKWQWTRFAMLAKSDVDAKEEALV